MLFWGTVLFQKPGFCAKTRFLKKTEISFEGDKRRSDFSRFSGSGNFQAADFCAFIRA